MSLFPRKREGELVKKARRICKASIKCCFPNSSPLRCTIRRLGRHQAITRRIEREFKVLRPGPSLIPRISRCATVTIQRDERSLALQTQPHLVFGGWQLSHDTGVAISGSHAFSRWIGVDGSAIVLPGGDAPNYQDGGTETALLAGLRVGVQHSRYGIFAKYRVGVASFASTINEKCGLTSACPRLGLRR
jgi:hypothetical protein